MPIAMHNERDNVYCVEIRGLLRKGDLEQCQEQLAAEMGRVGPVRLLFLLTDFQGWEPSPDWNDLTFYVTHGGAIERIAIVGPDQWRSEMLMFAGADLRSAPVEFFPPGTAAEAREWLSS